MLSPNCLIQEFIIPVPICSLTNCSTDLWSHLSRPELWVNDRLVVVNQEQLPIGVISLHSLIPYLNSEQQFLQLQSSMLAQADSAMHQSLMQPLQILSGTLSIRDFWTNLKQLTNLNLDRQEWGVVDPDGKFLGLLDTNRLLRFIASEYHLKKIPPDRHVGVSPVNEDELAQDDPTGDRLDDLLDRGAIGAIQQTIDSLPWPVKLQTKDDRAIVENLAWRQVFDNLSGGEISPALPTELGTGSTPLADRASTTLVSHLVTDSESEVTLMCSLTNGSEKAWKFFKIPLELDLSIAEPFLMWRSQQSLNNGFPARAKSQLKKLRSPPENPLTGDPLPGETSDPADIPPTSSLMSEEAIEQTAHRASTPEFGQTSSPAQISGWLILAEDVTEQQQVAKELVAKNADLVQLNRLKDEFLACISHELKTPLTAVLGLSTLLKDRALGPLNQRQARYAKMIHQSGQHLMRVVNDILDLTRIETGQLQLNYEPVDIKQVCSQAWQKAEEHQQPELVPGQQSIESNPEFSLDIEPGLITIVADHLRVRQMLYNLLSNALKFTSAEGEICLKVSRWQGWIAFTVCDTGIGIPADKQHLIFQRFQQLENPLTRRFEGTGLGLVITQGLARAHGGDVTFISKEDKGSQFTILLPPSPPEPGAIEEFPVRDRRLVLIVEAVPQSIEDLNEQLVRLGYRVAISRFGLDALEKARRLQPCVIFVNPLLPLLSGWDLLTLLKSDPQTGHIPTLVIATMVDKKRAKKYRADGCLSLPVKRSELQEELEHVVSVEVTQVAESKGSKLTILRLTGNLESTNTILIQGLRIQPEKNYQILEADDLEQAEMLAEIWRPQVILIEPETALPDPQVFFQEFSQSTLSTVPIVTMDFETTKFANKVPNLISFPCLIEREKANHPTHKNSLGADNNFVQPANSDPKHDVGDEYYSDFLPISSAQDLLQMIHLAAQFRVKPNILAVDISTMPEFYREEDEEAKFNSRINHLLELMSYMKAAELNTEIGRSWSEIWQLVQQESVDLLLIYIPVEHLVLPMIHGLKAIAQMAYHPQILMIHGPGKLFSESECDREFDHEHNTEFIEEKLFSILKDIATKILPNSLSKEELLNHIQQLLTPGERSLKHQKLKYPMI